MIKKEVKEQHKILLVIHNQIPLSSHITLIQEKHAFNCLNLKLILCIILKVI